MFIRQITKKNQGYDKTFTYHRLMESVRTPRGPRQRKILDLGKLDLPKDDWKTLADLIEQILSGQQSLFPVPPHIESLALHYAQLIQQKGLQSIPIPQEQEPDWGTVDLNSLSQGQFRTLGGESVGYDAFKGLGFSQMLSELGFSREQRDQAALLIIGRLLHPASERETALWGKEKSALEELLEADFQHLSNNALYRTCDQLRQHQDEIEERLAERERGLFGLGEKIILYDLTNTHLTGRGYRSEKAKRGRSKQRRHDCPLLTLALVVDEEGFPKKSQVLPGNVSEPKTLEGFLEAYEKELKGRLSLFKELPTVVIDAGVGTNDNLKLIRKRGFHYITVSRNRPGEIPEEGLLVIKEDQDSTIEVKRLDRDGEVILYCRSTARARKEEAMKGSFQKHFEDGLRWIASSLTKERGQKRYEKVVERLGRLRERYSSIARFYKIELKQEKGIVTRIDWEIDKEKELEVRFSGSYYIRSSRTDLEEKELWSLYMMLNQVEDSFRCLKSELGLRPVRHWKDHRMEGHLFISVLAYHLMASIQRQLKEKGISYRWETIRGRLASHMRATASITNDKGERIHTRQTGDPEPFHLEIYRALGLPAKPLRIKRFKV